MPVEMWWPSTNPEQGHQRQDEIVDHDPPALAEMGRAAAQVLGELIEDRPLRGRRVELSTELVPCESTGPLEVAR
jgi:hypothetical protein